jgi:glycosyltransferase involved in cell wall biosynthesis
MKRKRILAILPAFNEEKNVGQVIAEIKKQRLGIDILVVNDGSSDKTSQVARRAGALVIDLPVNLGIGGAVQTGFIYARDQAYDFAFQIDADGQHRGDQIKSILDPVLAKKVDVSIGSRFLGKGKYQPSFLRKIGMRIFEFVNSNLAGQKITDNTSGFRAYNFKAIKLLAEHYPDDYPEPEAVIILARNGLKIKEIPVKMRGRLSGTSSITFLRSAYYMVKVLISILASRFREPVLIKEAND